MFGDDVGDDVFHAHGLQMRKECPEELPQGHCENTHMFLRECTDTDLDISKRPGCFLMCFVLFTVKLIGCGIILETE